MRLSESAALLLAAIQLFGKKSKISMLTSTTAMLALTSNQSALMIQLPDAAEASAPQDLRFTSARISWAK
jgi:hypothetical protein